MKEQGKLTAGFARVDITPQKGGQPLAGYGGTHLRLHARVLDPLYANAVALGHGDQLESIMITADLINLPAQFVETVRKLISEALGIPGEHIFLGATHTHSAPDIHSGLPQAKHYRYEQLPPQFVEAARRAAADLKPCTISYGKTQVGHEGAWLNFNRYYYMVEKTKLDNYGPEDMHPVGDNFGAKYSGDPAHYVYVGHEEEADHEMLVVRLTRDAADDIVLVNFTGHATISGGGSIPNLSSDYPGALVQRVEQLLPGTKCVFLQGCAGNVNAGTRMVSEGIYGLTLGRNRDHHAYAAVLAGYVFNLFTKNLLIPSETETVGFRQRIHTAKRDHSMDHLLDKAKEVVAVYNVEGNTPAVREMCYKLGFSSPYHCTGVISKAAAPETGDIEINAIRLGDCAFVTAPFELFSGTGLRIKEKSPFPCTIVKAYSCGSQSYLPSFNSCRESYEATKTSYEFGTAEALEDVYQEMLDELKAL